MKRTFACSDLHGRLDLWKQIKNFLNPEDTVYFLGDAGDRGPDGWKLIKTLANDNQVIYLKGNHEDMLVNAAKDWLKYDGITTSNISLCWHNSGHKTFNDLTSENCINDWISYLNKLIIYTEYTNKNGIKIILTHAGATPILDLDNKIIFPRDTDFIWSREHFLDDWDKELNDIIIVHGHTPIPYLADDLRIKTTEPGALWYCDNHKVCIDNAAFWSNITCLFDLDTFDEHIFSIGETRWI